MIASSVVVIALICGLFLASHRTARVEQNRAQGASLVGTLADIPIGRLVPPPGKTGVFRLLKNSISNPDFAYAVFADPGGLILAEETATELTVPEAVVPLDPASWRGERTLVLSDGRRALEFHAPVLEDGELIGHVRIGYVEPSFAFASMKLSFLGVLALPIFLLTVLAHLWIRREVRPVTLATRRLDDALGGNELVQLQLADQGTTGEFAHFFNQFVDLCDRRLREFDDRQKQLETSSKILSYQKERSESVLDALPEAALVLDDTGTLTFANSRLQTMLRIDPAKAVGSAPAEWCPYEEMLQFLSRHTGPEAARRSGQMQFSPANDDELHFAVYAHPLANELPNARCGTLVLIRDVSASILAERAHSEFVSHVTHELKTPLNSIAMYAESLLDKAGDSEEFRIEACNVIQDEVSRLSELLKALHTIARIETGSIGFDRQRIALDGFIRDSIGNIERAGRSRGITIDVELAPDLKAIYADKDLLRVALNNLLTNAVKYSRDGGKVVVSAEESREQVAIRVADEGIGISEQDLSRIFDKFFRSQSVEATKRSGHGLGLALAREIAELLGGRIEVQSVEGEGSCFALVIPSNAKANGEES